MHENLTYGGDPKQFARRVKELESQRQELIEAVKTSTGDEHKKLKGQIMSIMYEIHWMAVEASKHWDN